MHRATPSQTAATARRVQAEIGTPPKDLEQLHAESQRLVAMCQQVLDFACQLRLDLGRAMDAEQDTVEYTE